MTDVANLFGPLISRNDVEAAIIATLREHMPAWLREINRRHPELPGDLPMPRSWQKVDALDDEPLNLTPTVIVAYRDGDLSVGSNGKLRAVFTGGLAVFTEAGAPVENLSQTSKEQSRWLAGTYLAVITAILAQQPDLGGIVSRTVLGSFSARDAGIGSDGTSQYAAGRLRADVYVDDIIDPAAGPSELYPAPVDSPPGDLLPVETVEVETSPEDL